MRDVPGEGANNDDWRQAQHVCHDISLWITNPDGDSAAGASMRRAPRRPDDVQAMSRAKKD